jgi:hypothetical protein
MRALVGFMMNQSNQIICLKEETRTLNENVKVFEDDLGTTKLKLYHMEYDLKDGDEHSVAKKAQLNLEDFNPYKRNRKLRRKETRIESSAQLWLKFSMEHLKVKL